MMIKKKENRQTPRIIIQRILGQDSTQGIINKQYIPTNMDLADTQMMELLQYDSLLPPTDDKRANSNEQLLQELDSQGVLDIQKELSLLLQTTYLHRRRLPKSNRR